MISRQSSGIGGPASINLSVFVFDGFLRTAAKTRNTEKKKNRNKKAKRLNMAFSFEKMKVFTSNLAELPKSKYKLSLL
jgi:hypothetical protein